MSEDTTFNAMDSDRAAKNFVFAAQGAKGMAETDSLDDMARAGIPLPSKGLVYPEGSPLHLKEDVEIREMTPREEDILLNRMLIRKGTVITELIKSCIIDKRIDVQTMLSGDRNALMVGVRVLGYGAEYDVKMTCVNCEAENEVSVDLTQLPVKDLDVEKVKQVELGRNLFEFKLPRTGHVVAFKFLTGLEEEEVLRTLEEKRKKGLAGSTMSEQLLKNIVAINGDQNRASIMRFVNKMPARDSLALRKHISDNEPTVDMTHPFSCASCGHKEVMAFPLGADFFYPNS